MNHLFISYQRESEAGVTALAEHLRQQAWLKEAKLDIWQDRSGKDTGIPFSVKWWETIRGALYSADGALIIKTEPWENSGPCSKEYTLILANRIPRLVIGEHELDEENRGELTERIRQWVEEQVSPAENQHRTYLFTQAYRMQQDRHVAHLLPKTAGFRRARKQYSEFSDRARYLKASGIEQSRPAAGKLMAAFLRKAKRKIIRDQLIRVLAVLGALAGAVMLAAAVRMLPNLVVDSYKSDYRARTNAAMDLIRDTAEYDPVSSLSLLTNDPSARNLDVHRAFYVMQYTMAGLLDTRFPVDFYAAGTAEAAAAQALETPEYPAVPDPVLGTASTLMKGGETHLAQACAPGAACYVPERNELIVAADSTVRAFDLDGATDGIPLVYNHETISRVTAQGGLVYGITDKGNVVCWENPVPVKTVRRALSEGVLLRGGGAAYTTPDSLVLQQDGEEKVYPVPFDCGETLAVSVDGQAAAVAGQDGDGCSMAALVRTGSGEITAVYELPENPYAMAFSRDGTRLYCAGSGTLAGIDLRTGETVSVPAEAGCAYYNVVPCLDHLIVGRTDGWIAEFGNDLRRTGAWMEITGGGVPAKQLAVSEANGTAFAACRGGNTVAVCRRITLADGSINRLVPGSRSGLFSNSCVAVSEDGAFTAYGFPNGRVTVWDAKQLNKLYEGRPAAEPVISLRFEGDGLYLLGRSGTVYREDFGGLVRQVEYDTLEEYWQAYTEKAAGIHRRMYELGLTYIKP